MAINSFNKNKEKRTGIAVYIIYAIALLAVFIYHEPWFDEAQSWQIAKCASIHDILFVIPHYEGHPPLWWLILRIPAKLGIPFEIGLKTVGYLISLASEFIIIFISPLPSIARYVLPFTWFLFYQYGVIVRPYGLMLLSILLLAIYFENRFTHPFRYCCLLFILCLTSAYGMLIAAGIAICMVYEIVHEKGLQCALFEMLKDRRTCALLLLMLGALLLAYQIRPYPEASAISSYDFSRIKSFPVVFIGASGLRVGKTN